MTTAFAFLRFFSYAQSFRPLAGLNGDAPFSPGLVVQHADARGLCDGSIWPKTGYASIV